MTTSASIRILYLGRSQKIARQIDEALQQEIQQLHSRRGRSSKLRMTHVTSQKRALEEVRRAPPHGVLVEIDSGRYNRRRFCSTLRSRLPQIVIVAVHAETVDPNALEFVFDGFISRPFQVEQARPALRSLLDGCDGMYLEVGDLHLDVAMRTVDGPQGEHHLPPKLCKLLQTLMENVGQTVAREELMQQVWDTEFLGDTRTLDVHVRWLREKIEPDPSSPTYLTTVRGQGYRLDSSAQ